MTTTWDDVNAKLTIFLKDADEDIYLEAQRISAWNDAQRLLAVHHTPRQRMAKLDVKVGGRSAVLPDDFLGIWQIYDADSSRWFKPYQPTRGEYRAAEDQLSQFWVWGKVLYFEREIDLGSTSIDLYYYAYWPEIETDTVSGSGVVVEDSIYIPRWAELPTAHLTAATCLVPQAIESARRRDYNILVDSGTPVMNSRMQQAREHLFWWSALLAMAKPTDWKS